MTEPRPLRERTVERLDHRVAEEQRERRLPSIVAGVVRDGTLVWSTGCGFVGEGDDEAPPTNDTQYRIGSITKTMTAVAVMRLRDEGLVDLHAPVATYAPGAPDTITVQQVLAHSAGLQSETEGLWWERAPGGGWDDLAPSLTPAAVKHDPGSRFHYSNLGFGILGEVVARVRGRSWWEVVRDEVLLPLGMQRSTPRPVAPAAQGFSVHPYADLLLPQPEHDAGALAPAGQVWCSLTDLARWATFLGGDVGDVLAADTLQEMFAPRSIHDIDDGPWTGGMGLGVQVMNIDGTRLVGHGGSMPGFLAMVWVEPDTGLGITFAMNTTSGLGPDLFGDMRRILAEEEPPPPVEPWRPEPAAAAHLDLVGPWYWGPRPYVLRVTGEDEFVLAPVDRGRASAFERAEEDVWIGRDDYYAGETLRVHRNGDGVPTHLDLATFIFTRTPYDPAAPIPGGVDPSGWR